MCDNGFDSALNLRTTSKIAMVYGEKWDFKWLIKSEKSLKMGDVEPLLRDYSLVLVIKRRAVALSEGQK